MTSHLKVGEGNPGLRLDLVDSDDEPFEEGAGGARRPSTASLSRFRSCPQLSSADTQGQDSPGSDDHGLGPELCVGSAHFTHGSPRARQRGGHQHGDNNNNNNNAGGGGGGAGRSQTPTPPSTPGSRRSHVSLKEALGKGGGGGGAGEGGAGGGGGSGAVGGGGGGGGATASAKAVGRTRLEQALLGRAASTDTDPALRLLDESYLRKGTRRQTGSERGSKVLSEFFEEPPDISIDERLTMTEDGASTPAGGVPGEPRRYHGGDQDSMDKCARWLQSLKMTSGDRLKSRSHIQLPPI